MNSEPVYVVIAIDDASHVWSERFITRRAADHASSFLKQNNINAWVIADVPDHQVSPSAARS